MKKREKHLRPLPHTMKRGGTRMLFPYDRAAAVRYARTWALGRNPAYYDFEALGGDCTNFASQCVFAGSRVMNETPTFGWYYRSANDRAPAWTGVGYFYQFITRKEATIGPYAREVALQEIEPGDVLQLSFDAQSYQHTPVVVDVLTPGDPSAILLAAHSYDAERRALSTYDYRALRSLHIVGVYR